MGEYRKFHVSTFKTLPGKRLDGEKWWTDKARPMFQSMPGVKSVNAYVTQFGLGGEYEIEVWLEIENYAAYDQVDQDVAANPQKYQALAEAEELFETGPGRLMGDWPASDLSAGS